MLDVDVDATAFRAVALTSEGEGRTRRIALRLDSGDVVVLAPSIRCALSRPSKARRPRVAVRHGFEAELSRSVYYELAELALAEGARAARHLERRRFLPARGRRMSLADRLRDGAYPPRRPTADRQATCRSFAPALRLPRLCWWPSPTGPSRA